MSESNWRWPTEKPSTSPSRHGRPSATRSGPACRRSPGRRCRWRGRVPSARAAALARGLGRRASMLLLARAGCHIARRIGPPIRSVVLTGPATEGGALRAVAADTHRAPLRRAIARRVVESPAAVGVRAGLQAGEGAVLTGLPDDREGEGAGGG